MKPGALLASVILSALAGVPAYADDSRAGVHVTADGPVSLVEETPAGRIVVCGQLPCDVALDPRGVYRFVGAPGTGIRDSQPIVLQAGTHVDLGLQTRTNKGLALGWVFFGVGSALLVGGIVALAVGTEMDQQTPHSGEALAWVGAFGGLVPGLVMALWGIGGVARNLHSDVTASPAPPPPERAAFAPSAPAFLVPLVAAPF